MARPCRCYLTAKKGDGVQQATGHSLTVGALAALLCGACVQLPQAGPDSTPVVKAETPPSQPPAPVVVTTLDERIKEAAEKAAEKAEAVSLPAPTPAEAAPAAPPPVAPPNIWHRVRAGFRLPSIDGAL